jgi:A/G-specific adenine glycosylase
MLQQTPVTRVEPVWHDWMTRWPTPGALAGAEPADAVRAWGRLGYPRRALRLHAAARTITTSHDGVVPSAYDELVALPGVGDYTAAAVASFAYGRRHAVLDTNVRRVLARALDGRRHPAQSVTVAERRRADDALPADGAAAAAWSVGVMELGALVCTARTPACGGCPLADVCRWRLAGSPPNAAPPRRTQAWVGTDRYVRGTLMAVLRESADPVPRSRLRAAWSDDVQRERALDGLVADGLVEPLDDGDVRLPAG